MIQMRGLTKRYGATTAVDGLGFDVRPGAVTGFPGPNGSGKSTTMRLIMGLDRPDHGTATVNGKPYRELRWPLREVGALLEARTYHPGRSAQNHLAALAAASEIPPSRVDAAGHHGRHDRHRGGRDGQHEGAQPGRRGVLRPGEQRAGTVEKHVAAVFGKLGLPSSEDANRRVLAVLRYLGVKRRARESVWPASVKPWAEPATVDSRLLVGSGIALGGPCGITAAGRRSIQPRPALGGPDV